jgi:hypothetical protein
VYFKVFDMCLERMRNTITNPQVVQQASEQGTKPRTTRIQGTSANREEGVKYVFRVRGNCVINVRQDENNFTNRQYRVSQKMTLYKSLKNERFN